MKKLLIGLFIILSGLSFASKDDILGMWITEKGDTGNQIIVEIYKTADDKFNGVIRGLTIPTYTEGEYIG